jgi:hypothetical protein
MRHRRHVMCSSRCVNWLGEDLLSHFHRRKLLVKVKPQCGTLLSLRQRKSTPRRHYAPPTELYVCPLPVSIISDHHVTYNSGLVCSTQRRKAAAAAQFHVRKPVDCVVHSDRIAVRSIEEDQLNTAV